MAVEAGRSRDLCLQVGAPGRLPGFLCVGGPGNREPRCLRAGESGRPSFGKKSKFCFCSVGAPLWAGCCPLATVRTVFTIEPADSNADLL